MNEIKSISQGIKFTKRTIKIGSLDEIPKQGLNSSSQESIKECSAKLASVVKIIQSMITGVNYEFLKYRRPMDEFISNKDKIAKILAEAPEKTRKIHNEFSKFGWYFYNLMDYTIRGLGDIYDLINSDLKNNKEEYIETIDDFMNEVVEENSEKIINNLIDVFPERFEIIQDAYNAHKQKLYTLSIPTMLTQIEGISREILGESIYSKIRRKSEPKTKQSLEKIFKENNIDKNKEDLWYAINYYPLEILHSLVINTDNINCYYEKNKIYSTFNRHGVIHGLDIKYNNKTNSNKCIAILGYLYNLKEVLDYDIENTTK
ncbi:hypothetical protein KQI86_16760 [Clostridium sp. MSJ-11]|uniref:Uncharacterized protein n=1 Tax=Clostridium mobile TaxID=2841512 RepID=A0ABS6EL84_9CLOT|nr:hypothetical protein [Clostridium mobile]MBU5485974.1 hypothetical protein [Clostridium mobile]